MVNTIEWSCGKVRILDQSKLPVEVSYIDCTDYLTICDIIKTLKIRGAPAIGIAAAMAIALGAQDIKASGYEDFIAKLNIVFDDLLETRPTAVNIQWAVERIKRFLVERKADSVDSLKTMLIGEAESILAEDIEVNKAIGRYGAEFIRDGDSILTHCNAGSLATGGYGTATAAIYTAWEQGKKIHVFVDETRPVLQGARLTAWELTDAGIPMTLITDNSAGAIMRKGEIDLAIVGTDRTVKNGDVANKIGTYSVSVLCRAHNIPFYVAAPLSSIDFTIESGDMIPIEERASEEVCMWGCVQTAPHGVRVRNMAFDVTPAENVTAIITELGAFRPRDIKKLLKEGLDIAKIRYDG